MQETSTEKTSIEVVATEGSIDNRKGIWMSLVVGYIGKDATRQLALIKDNHVNGYLLKVDLENRSELAGSYLDSSLKNCAAV